MNRHVIGNTQHLYQVAQVMKTAICFSSVFSVSLWCD